MRALVALCTRHYAVVTALTLLLLALGFMALAHAPLDVFPDFVPTQVEVQTEAPGFAPEQVESLVTRPIENGLGGVTGLATLRSESIPGLSVVTIVFDDRIDVHLARQSVAERLAELGSALPAGVATPRLSPLVSSTMDLLKIGLVSDKVDAYTLRDAGEWVVKPRLLAVPGVAHVILFGGAVREIAILPDVRKLVSLGLTLEDVANAARTALALRGAGFIDSSEQRILLEAPVPSPDLARLGKAVLGVRHGIPIRLQDVAEVRQKPALRSGDALIMGRSGVLLSLASQYGANTLDTTQAVEKVLASLKPVLAAQGITVVDGLHRPANFIERALRSLERSLLIAVLLIIVVLFLFLRDWRAALIAFLAIPLSLLAAIGVLEYRGYTLNTMTLGGFAVALGVLVDDAIIGIENILRRLRQRSTERAPLPLRELIESSVLEVRAPVIYATLVVIAVFIPELLTSSVQGHFVAPLALACILAISASLIVAVTTTPALCVLLLGRHGVPAEARWLTKLKEWQSRVLSAVERRFAWVAAGLALLIIAAAALLPFLGGTFMPDFREGHFVIQASSAPGTSLDEMLRIGRRMGREILTLPYVRSVEQQVGRAEAGEDTWGPHQSELHVELRPDATVDQAVAQQALRRIASAYPGVQSEVVTFLGDRIAESLSGETAQVAIKVFGTDLATLDAVAGRMVEVLRTESGITDLTFKRQDATPAIRIDPDVRKLAAWGVTAQQVMDTVQSAYAGVKVGDTFDGARTVPVVLLLPDAQRNRPEELAALDVDSPAGPIPLARLASIRPDQDRYSIEHDGGQRRVAVTFNVQGRSLQDVVTEARQRIQRSIPLPLGTVIEFTGAAQAEIQTRRELYLYSTVALALVVMLLLTSTRWSASGWLILANLPFSVLGGVYAIALSGVGISLGSLVGLVTVFGISARNAILQVAHYEQLVETERENWSLDLVRRGANERLVPILMTATVTALGLVPLAAGLHSPGEEIEAPMAIAVLGGLFTSTALNLFVLPILVHRYGGPPRHTAVEA